MIVAMTKCQRSFVNTLLELPKWIYILLMIENIRQQAKEKNVHRTSDRLQVNNTVCKKQQLKDQLFPSRIS